LTRKEAIVNLLMLHHIHQQREAIMATIGQQVLETIRRQPGISDAAIARELGIRHQQANQEARHLVNRGLVERRDGEAPDGSIGNFPLLETGPRGA
jgi:DNA-binding MarR family transcriptional regulator